MKTHLNISDSSTDSYIQDLINAAADYCERETQTDWRSKQWKLTLDSFRQRHENSCSYLPYGDSFYGYLPDYSLYYSPYTLCSPNANIVDLMRAPLVSVDSVQYYDSDNTLTTWATSEYRYTTPSYLAGVLQPNTTFPTTYSRIDAVQVTFTTGFSSVPDRGKQAIRLIVGSWWNSREDIACNPGTVGYGIGEMVKNLLSSIRGLSYQ